MNIQNPASAKIVQFLFVIFLLFSSATNFRFLPGFGPSEVSALTLGALMLT